MLSWRLQTGSEKAELQELNARLYDYVCRVRELERENSLLEEELRGRRGQEGLWIEGQARFAEEARSLRQQLDELSWATALAEGERDALRRELRELQRLSAEESAARGRLDAELGAQRRELQEALGARAALEALLGRLQAERRGLDASHERDVRELRTRAANLTLHFRARASAPPPRLREVQDSYALLVAESWRDTVQMYEEEVRELEQALLRGQESRRRAEEEARLCAHEADALRAEARELELLRARLEDELLRMREEYQLQVEERQRVIDCLEDEREALTLAMADRLRDYQELVQVKTGLSLEVATYRALLEGESNPEILIWTENVENMPQESRNTSYQYTDSILQRKNEKNLFSRPKAPWASLNHTLYLNGSGHLGSETTSSIGSAARRGFLASGYSSSATTQQKNSYEKTITSQANLRAISPTCGLIRNTDAQLKTFPDRPKPKGSGDPPARFGTVSTVARESYQEQRDKAAADAMHGTRSNERTVTVERKIEVKSTREQERDRPGAIKIKPEEKMFDSKEKASEERNLRWEELTKLDKEARTRESQQMRERANEKDSLKEKSVKGRDIPISLEVSRGSRQDVSEKGLQTPGKKDAGDSRGREAETRGTRFRLDTSDTASSLQGDSMTETIAENIVTTILKQFTQSPDVEETVNSLPDTKVTYMNRKELPGERKTKTEIVVESKLTEDIDISDEASLDHLLSKDIKEVGLKGKSAERMIGDMINLGLKGREGKAKVVNVEIVEEPMSYVGGGRAEEFSTPFQVEEVDDLSPSTTGVVEEEGGDGETDVTFSVHQHQRTRKPQGNISHVEEVTEAGDSEGEQSYFVSTPDEYPGGQDREDEGSVYGQIHIEEESTIRYSWQDEIVQGTWRRKKRDETEGEKDVKTLELVAPSLGGSLSSAHWKEEASGELHAEPTVIEKEIKIPHEFHTSIKGVFSKEPRHQLAEVIGQLEDTLPERMKEELSTLTREGQDEPGSISVDVKKVQSSCGGSVTLLAEVNLSQTVDADQLDLEELSRDEAGEIEKAVESVVRESLSKRPSSTPGSPQREDGKEVPAGGIRFKRWATRELYSLSDETDGASLASHSSDKSTAQGPVSATVEVTSPRGFAQSQVLEDISQSVRHVKLGPSEMWRTEQVSYGGPMAQRVEVSEDGSQAVGSEGATHSVGHFTVGPHQGQVSTEIIFHGLAPAWQEAGDTEEPDQTRLSAVDNTTGRHITFGSKQFPAEKGPDSGTGEAGGNLAADKSGSTQTSVTHFQSGPKEGLREEIQFTAPLPDKVEWGVHRDTESPWGSSTAARLIRPQRHHTSQQIAAQPGDSADVTQAIHSDTSDRKILVTEKSTFQRVISESPQDSVGEPGAEVTSGISRTFRHIWLGPSETETSKHTVVHGPLAKTFALAGSVASPELDKLANSSSTLSHIALGPKETSFTFQMDVSNARAIHSWTQEAGMEVEAHRVSDGSGWMATHSRSEQLAGTSSQASAGDRHQSTEEADFDKTVQLQRMVDQRSVVSDEKKVALLYLDNEEEDEGDGWF
uniref:synemin isoform X2 n=1 Tax=Jaculus jaculus TaxID=51337 RepID=UPI001E1B5FC4|nr:synemin isoform X2 [Jaculus jaculus]